MKIPYKHPTFLYANDIEQICKPLKSLGIEYFSHVIIDENNTFSGIATCPEFSELYIKKEYYNFDIHRSIQHQGQNYIIWDNIDREPQLNQVYDDFKSFSFGHSFTISYKDLNGYKHYYDFSAALNNENINHTYLRNIESLKLFILYFNEQINKNRELKKGYDFKFCMNNQDTTLEMVNPLSLPLKRFYFSSDVYLTLREFQCLTLLASGKTIAEISLTLAISLRTCKAHVINIKNKLRCKNLFQLGLAFQAWKEINLDNLKA